MDLMKTVMGSSMKVIFVEQGAYASVEDALSHVIITSVLSLMRSVSQIIVYVIFVLRGGIVWRQSVLRVNLLSMIC